MNVRQMLRSMTAKEFLEWRAYYSLEPFGEERADLRSAQITAAIFNTNIDPKKTKPFKIEDVVLRFEEETKVSKRQKQSWVEQKNIAKSFAAMFRANHENAS